MLSNYRLCYGMVKIVHGLWTGFYFTIAWVWFTHQTELLRALFQICGLGISAFTASASLSLKNKCVSDRKQTTSETKKI